MKTADCIQQLDSTLMAALITLLHIIKKRYRSDATRRAEIFAELMAKPLTRNSP
jgi:hypothetical protein